ncbi:MAG: type VII secretion protein EccC [Ktedonobacteraceae bacterium]
MISAPPTLSQSSSGGATAWLQLLVPLVGSLGSIIFVIVYHTNPLILFAAVGIAVISVGLGLAMRLQQNNVVKKRLQTERKAYMGYLDRLGEELSRTAQIQQRVNSHLYPSAAKLVDVVRQHNREQPQLWERRPEDQDFLHVRMGLGATQLCRPVRLDIANGPFIEYVPELLSAGQALVTEYNHLDQAPIELELNAIGTLAITGNSQVTRGLMRSILCQLATFHSPEDVRFVVYYPSSAEKDWNWLKWLPHVRRLHQVKLDKQYAPESLCLLADTVADFQDLLSKQISRELGRRHQLSEDKKESATDLMRPHIVLVLDGFSPDGELAQLPDIVQLFQDPRLNGIDPAKHGVTVICLVNTIRQEPSAIKARITVSDMGQLTFQKIREGGSRLAGIMADAADVRTCEQVARGMAPLTLADKGAQQDLSQDVHLLSLLNIAAADAIQTAETWQPRPIQHFLSVPIGRRADGAALMLDLKEAAEKGMGPHGLVVGATGSGKSELLRTLVTSLAITHDPNMVNFVLIDFKGGASFADFATMPHVAGIVTNLKSDLLLVNRVYESLQGEQERRQKMLREADNLSKIKEYQSKWRTNPTTMEPMPYLMIIVDEFAELITNRADFLDLFVGIGRVGRSLGMHLLLATQRLEEGRLKGLETYLSYRICLRTFSTAESNIALGTADAFYLPSAPGVGYFKVDTNIYSLFKTALISTPYVPTKEQKAPTALIREFTSTGKLVSSKAMSSSISGQTQAMALASRTVNTVDNQFRTEMEIVIRCLADAQASRRQGLVHQVSLPPLEKLLTLDTILKTSYRSDLDGSGWQALPAFGTLRIPIGLLDKPIEQAQEPLELDFSGAGGHLALVGAPQSGKSTLLRTIIASLMVTHSPRDVQLYCIDMGGGLLRAFDAAPHVGTVCTSSKMEGDKIRRLVRQMRKIIEERAFLFQEQRIDSMATYRGNRQAGELSNVPFGDVFLIIDNLAQLYHDFDQLKDEIIDIVATGLNYGVHVILAANRWGEIPPKLRENIGTRLELRLNDPVESDFGKAAASTVPTDIPGRGLTKDKLQFQTALPWVGSGRGGNISPDTPLQEAIELLVQRTQRGWKGAPAPAIRMLPDLIPWQSLPQPGRNQPAGVPIGVDEFRIEPVYLDLTSIGPHFLIFGDAECGKTNLFRAWMRGIEQRYTPEEVQFAVIDFRRKLVDLTTSKHLVEYAHVPSKLKECVEGLKGVLDRRQQLSSQLPLEQLANPQKWSGPRYFLFVDDYDILMAQAANPLTPLYEHLLHARDTGFHLILARSAGGAAGFDTFIKRVKDLGCPGLVMNGNPLDGALLGTQKASPFPPGRGYLVRRRYPPTQIQIAFVDN